MAIVTQYASNNPQKSIENGTPRRFARARDEQTAVFRARIRVKKRDGVGEEVRGCQNRLAGVRALLRVLVREGGQIERIVMAVICENMVDFQFLHVCSDDEVGE